MYDEKIIALFQNRDERAVQACMDTYGSYCRVVAAGILSDSGDIEEAVADTWLLAWNCIPPQHPQCLRLFSGRITRHRAISIWRKKYADSRGGGQVAVALEELGECIATGSSVEDNVDVKELQGAITKFLKSRPAVHRQMFLRRYFYLEEIPAIACRCGLKEGNVRMILSRTRQKLRKYLIQEGYNL